jgi:hypothetical protein
MAIRTSPATIPDGITTTPGFAEVNCVIPGVPATDGNAICYAVNEVNVNVYVNSMASSIANEIAVNHLELNIVPEDAALNRPHSLIVRAAVAVIVATVLN